MEALRVTACGAAFSVLLALTPIEPVRAPPGLPDIIEPGPNATASCAIWCVQYLEGAWRLRFFVERPAPQEIIAWELAPSVDVGDYVDKPCRRRLFRPRGLQVAG